MKERNTGMEYFKKLTSVTLIEALFVVAALSNVFVPLTGTVAVLLPFVAVSVANYGYSNERGHGAN